MPARAATPLNGRLDMPAWLSSPTPVLSSGVRGSERDKPMPARQARSSASFVSTGERAGRDGRKKRATSAPITATTAPMITVRSIACTNAAFDTSVSARLMPAGTWPAFSSAASSCVTCAAPPIESRTACTAAWPWSPPT